MEANYSNVQFNCSFSRQMDHFGPCIESRQQRGQERKQGASEQTTAFTQVRDEGEMTFLTSQLKQDWIRPLTNLDTS